MILWIEGVVDNYSIPLSQTLVDALTELGDAGYLGRHVVLAPRPLLLHFSRIDALSNRARAYFARVASEFTQLGHVIRYPYHLIVSPTAVAPTKYGDTWTVPLTLFAVSEHVMAAKVVCENDSDYEVLKAFAGAYVREALPGCVTYSTSHAGGGGNTATVISRMVTGSNPVFACILDSDREAVLGAEGSTARGVRGVWEDSWRSHLFVMTAREIENSLPIEIISIWAKSERMDVDLIESLKTVHRDLADYVCLKSGERLCRFHALSPSHAGHRRTTAALSVTARLNRRFQNCGVACGDCECDVIPRLGDRFLEKFAGWISSFVNARRIGPTSTWSEDLLAAVRLFVGVAAALPRKI